jgi:hypothetical protein
VEETWKTLKSTIEIWPLFYRTEERSIKIAQLSILNETVYQTTSGSLGARNMLKKLKTESLPDILGVE